MFLETAFVKERTEDAVISDVPLGILMRKTFRAADNGPVFIAGSLNDLFKRVGVKPIQDSLGRTGIMNASMASYNNIASMQNTSTATAKRKMQSKNGSEIITTFTPIAASACVRQRQNPYSIKPRLLGLKLGARQVVSQNYPIIFCKC